MLAARSVGLAARRLAHYMARGLRFYTGENDKRAGIYRARKKLNIQGGQIWKKRYLLKMHFEHNSGYIVKDVHFRK